jgi:hypothetical protein
MCTNCPKCETPIRLQFGITNSDNIQITFLNGLSIDSSNQTKQIFQVGVLENPEDVDLFDRIVDLLEKSQTENEVFDFGDGDAYLDGETVKSQIDFSKNQINLSANQIKDVDRFYQINLTEGVPVFHWQNQNIQVSKIDKFDEIINNKINSHEVKSEIQPQTTESKAKETCKRKELYILRLSPDDFKYIINSSIREEINYFILVTNECQNQSPVSVTERVKEVSYSVSFLYFSKVLEFTFLQLLNSKDFLDIVNLDKFRESERFNFVTSKLNPFDCMQMPQHSNPLDGYQSNIKIKSIFIQTESIYFIFHIYNSQQARSVKSTTSLM